jgi:putative ABC transport system ATP-binding protein
VGLDVGDQQREGGIDEPLHLLGITPLGDRREADDVGEQHGDDATLLVGDRLGNRRLSERGAAVRTEASALGDRLEARWTPHQSADRSCANALAEGRKSVVPAQPSSTGIADRLNRNAMSSATPAAAPPPSTLVAAAGAIDAKKIYGIGDAAVRALDGVTVSFEPGRFTAIMGPSGSGKSTLLHCLAGLDELTEGAVFIGETYLATLGDKQLTELRRKEVGFIFQAYNLIPTLTARENILLPLMLGGEDGDEKWIDRVVETVGLTDRQSHRPSELSGGQQQRVAVARALSSKPTIIFADEPTGNLDSNSGGEILQFMRDAVNEFGQTIVMVTHDPNAAAYADRVVFLADGKIVHDMSEPTVDKIVDRMKQIGR